jgi:hypothetical protein
MARHEQKVYDEKFTRKKIKSGLVFRIFETVLNYLLFEEIHLKQSFLS